MCTHKPEVLGAITKGGYASSYVHDLGEKKKKKDVMAQKEVPGEGKFVILCTMKIDQCLSVMSALNTRHLQVHP